MFIIKDRNTGEVIASGSEEDNTALTLEGCWYFTPENVDMTYMIETDRTYNCPYKGICYWFDLDSGETQGRNIAFVYKKPMENYEHIAGRIAFYSRDTSATLAIEERETRR